ncbi:unnamed protein product [Spirodela intermedia]|uniref:Uncharacterized protein n=1 Tax=Spirodela intermedia TaxID=51605 RepID=A0A7I8JHR6_SPIIN|nr:unnamed protein product [Spirodela intermedia]CAA6669461.1 unnamed protein product [Spirodela intermedia]
MLNRSFNGPERGSTVSSSVPLRQKHQHHPQQQQPPRGRTLGAVIKEKDEELALFLEMRKREKERQNSLLLNNNSDELDTLPDSKPGSSPIFKIVSSVPTRRTGADDFLNSDNNKNDYDWLLTPPGTPLFPSLDKETQRSPVGHIGTPKTRPTMLKSRAPDLFLGHRRRWSGKRRPSSSGGLSLSSVSSRPATPTGRPVHPPAVTSSRPSRSSTPTSRASITSSTRPAAAAPPRSSTPAAARSSTPTSIRSSSAAAAAAAAPSNPSSSRRSATPTATARRASGPPPPLRSSAPATRSSVPSTRSSVPSPRGPSPTVRSRPWKPSEMPGFSLDAPPNLRTSMPERPSSASRGRPGGAPAARSASVEATARLTGAGAGGGGRGRRQSSWGSSKGCTGGKSSSSPDSSGFGRNLSKKSLDMAMRHMDIRRSIPNSLRPLMTNIPASSMYSVRSSGSTGRTRAVGVSDSPLATSSNASSELSVSNVRCLYGSEVDDDKETRSSSSSFPPRGGDTT